MINKTLIKQEIHKKLQHELELATEALEHSRDLMSQDDMKPEGKYDTRRTEVGYLVQAQGKRVEELKSDIAYIDAYTPKASDKVEVGAIAKIGHEDNEALYFISPTYSGYTLDIDNVEVHVLSLKSPIAEGAMTLEEGEFFEVESPKGELEYQIIEIF
ncbi:GreA/GreB family elongation factor [Bacteriovorax sp. Seq25_V]|uniref:GreA/GreB family elongation factor n=1 Tax=Bacteriovorax sp. Seq25_V TaxID=1201288 RepID=UPI00038A4E7C|nr:GreA/GreB family elongation factor [Bacteriovorax sp. Seq25_V]EQC45502.1 transcription elongation factor GreA/GreB, C-terminal domain protein [Bacteriovorax sp. Seq25_V]